jgi:hypothetical protein
MALSSVPTYLANVAIMVVFTGGAVWRPSMLAT